MASDDFDLLATKTGSSAKCYTLPPPPFKSADPGGLYQRKYDPGSMLCSRSVNNYDLGQ